MSSQGKTYSEQLGDQPSSAPDSPASPTVLQANVGHLVMNVILQENSKESFGRLNSDGSLLRTSRGYAQVNLDGFLESSCMTFPRWGMLSDGVVGELQISEHVIGANGSSSLPTMTKSDCEGGVPPNNGKYRVQKNGTKWGLKLSQKIALLPTYRSRESGNHQYANGDHEKPILTLSGVINLLPTCTGRDYKDTGNLENVPMKSLLPRVLGKRHGLKLQPAFAEWMMGFPLNWTDLIATPIVSHPEESAQSALDASEMPSSRSKSTRSSKRLQTLKKESAKK